LIEELVDASLNIFDPGSVYLLTDLEHLWKVFHGQPLLSPLLLPLGEN
jgi:hypothetical protein